MNSSAPRRLRRCFAALSVVLALAGLPVMAARADLVTYDKGEASIDTKGGAKHFTLEIARNEASREQGLMYRSSMAADAGMLFLFDQPQRTAFWMKNTLIPLDMLFIGADGHIVNIAKRAVPMSETSIFSDGAVEAVIELNGGTADRLDIEPGDRVHAPGLP